MRSIREIMFRAKLDVREAKLLRAIALETMNYLSRHHVAPELPPELRQPGGGPRSRGAQELAEDLNGTGEEDPAGDWEER
jgi:hypothetical protein